MKQKRTKQYWQLSSRAWLAKRIAAKRPREIAEEIGCKTGRVYLALSRARLQWNKAQPWSPLRYKGPDLVAFHGVPVADLLKEVQTTRTTLADLGRRFGVSRERMRQVLKAPRKPSIADLLARGVSVTAILKMGYSPTTVRTCFLAASHRKE
jgi:hypothetical protein